MKKSSNKTDATVKVPKRRGYTVIPNGLLPEGKVSARSWGLYAYLLSRPPGWEVRASHLTTVFSEGRDATYTALKQLVTVGLMRLEGYRNEDGLPRKRYVIVDPDEVLKTPNPDFQDTDFQDSENPGVVTTDITSPEINPSINSFTSNVCEFDQTSSTSNESDDPFTSRPHPDKHAPGDIPEWKRDELRDSLRMIGTLMKQGNKFYSDVVQERWDKFMDMMRLHLGESTYETYFEDMLINGKWTVSAKVSDPYQAGIELNKILNTGFSQ